MLRQEGGRPGTPANRPAGYPRNHGSRTRPADGRGPARRQIRASQPPARPRPRHGRSRSARGSLLAVTPSAASARTAAGQTAACCSWGPEQQWRGRGRVRRNAAATTGGQRCCIDALAVVRAGDRFHRDAGIPCAIALATSRRVTFARRCLSWRSLPRIGPADCATCVAVVLFWLRDDSRATHRSTAHELDHHGPNPRRG